MPGTVALRHVPGLTPMPSEDPLQSDFDGYVLRLPPRRRRSNKELEQAKAAEEASRQVVQAHLFRKGIASDEPEVADFAGGIRECFNEVIINSYRQSSLQAIQVAPRDDDHDLFELIGKTIPTGSSNITKWKLGIPEVTAYRWRKRYLRPSLLADGGSQTSTS